MQGGECDKTSISIIICFVLFSKLRIKFVWMCLDESGLLITFGEEIVCL